MMFDFIHKKGYGFSGMTFGVMDGVLTVTSVLVGLGPVADKSAVVLAMFIVGLADSMANAAGIRVSQETVVHLKKSQIFRSMLLAFLGTFIVTVALIIPLIFFDMSTSIYVSTFLGILLMIGLGIFVGTRRMYKSHEMLRLIAEYIITAGIIITISHTLGLMYNNPWVVLWLRN